MESTIRRRFVLEAVLALLAGSLAVLTVVWPDWIEALTPFDRHRAGGCRCHPRFRCTRGVAQAVCGRTHVDLS
jgi:hypothetical protein